MSGEDEQDQAGSPPPPPPDLCEVLQQEYPVVADLRKARVGAKQSDVTALETAVQAKLAELHPDSLPLSDRRGSQPSPSEELLKEATVMLGDPRKAEFHDPLQLLQSKAAAILPPSPKPFKWVSSQLPLEMMHCVRDGWDPAIELKQGFYEQDRAREAQWRTLSALLSRPINDEVKATQPLLEVDSVEDRRRGWNLEWTWKRRAQFNWGIETLREAFESRETYHSELQNRIDLLAAHMAVINQVADACRTACNSFCALGGERNARAYQNQMAPLMDLQQSIISHKVADLEVSRAESASLEESDARHLDTFHQRENSGGVQLQGLVELQRQYQEELEAAFVQRDRDIENCRKRKEELVVARQGEIDRALRESKAFLDENTREQEECDRRAGQAAVECTERIAGLHSLLEENATKQREERERHDEQCSARAADESLRALLMSRLKEEARQMVHRLEEETDSLAVELAYAKDVMTPFCHSMALTITACQRDHLLELYGKAEAPPLHHTECLAPVFVYRAKLCSSLIGCCEDIDNILEAAATQLEFCKETDDPHGAVIAESVAELQGKREAMVQEATQSRLNMATDLKCWAKFGRRPDELWASLQREMQDDDVLRVKHLLEGGMGIGAPVSLCDTIPVLSAQNVIPDDVSDTRSLPGTAGRLPGAIRSPPTRRLKTPFPSDSKNLSRGFHISRKLPVLSPSKGLPTEPPQSRCELPPIR